MIGCGERKLPEAVEQSIRPAKVVKVSASGSSKRKVYVGRVEASNSIDLSFEVAGPLLRFPVLEGQTVNEGELIAQLDSTDYELAVEEAELDVLGALVEDIVLHKCESTTVITEQERRLLVEAKNS